MAHEHGWAVTLARVLAVALVALLAFVAGEWAARRADEAEFYRQKVAYNGAQIAAVESAIWWQKRDDAAACP